jgi:hypothetical protein
MADVLSILSIQVGNFVGKLRCLKYEKSGNLASRPSPVSATFALKWLSFLQFLFVRPVIRPNKQLGLGRFGTDCRPQNASWPHGKVGRTDLAAQII